MPGRSWMGGVALAASVGFLLTGCSGATESPESPSSTSPASASADSTTSAPASESSGGSFSIALEEPQTLIPSQCYNLYCSNVLSAMFTGLFSYETNSDGTIAPRATELVDSVATPDGGTTWSITLNEGWTFTNGEPITAQTFVDTYNFAAYGDNGQQLGFVFGPTQLDVVGYQEVADSTVQEMSGLAVVSPTEFTITLNRPLGQELFANFLAGPQIYPMPSVAFDDIEAYNRQPIGNGPYLMAEPWVPNQKVVLVRNPGYQGSVAGRADSVEFRIYNDTTAVWADLQADNVDVVPQLPQDALAQAPEVLGDRYINNPGALASQVVFYPQQVDTFQNRDVRVALAKAIDRQAIVEKLLSNTQQPATAFAPATIPGGGTDACGDDCVFDPEAARALLEGAGGIPGNAVQMAGLQGSPTTVAEAECDQIQRNLAVECTVKLFPDFGALLEAYSNLGPSDTGLIASLGWGAESPTLQSMLAPLFASDSPSNLFGYNNPEFDRLIEEGNAAQDPQEQIAAWQQAQEIVYSDFYSYASYWFNTVAGYSTRVSNVSINPQGLIDVAEIEVNQ